MAETPVCSAAAAAAAPAVASTIVGVPLSRGSP
jgi:hypothetical protein